MRTTGAFLRASARRGVDAKGRVEDAKGYMMTGDESAAPPDSPPVARGRQMELS